MPPKKKPDKKKEAEEAPVGYNVAIMTLDQLKQYAVLLQNEIEGMRSHCNFYQKMEDELVELLRITEEDMRSNEDGILCKDVELEKLKLKFLKHLEDKRQFPKYVENSKVLRKETLSSEFDNLLQKEQHRHSKEKERLGSILREKDRQLESLRIKVEMARKDIKERKENYLKDAEDHQQNLLEQAIERFDSVKKETLEDFKQAQDIMETMAREQKNLSESSFNAACETYKRKLHNYYKEVTKQDLDTIKNLKLSIKKIEENNVNSKLRLEMAQGENDVLKTVSQIKVNTKRGSEKLVPKFEATHLKLTKALKMHNATEKISIENEILVESIHSVTEKTSNLRRDFASALRKVRGAAETKSGILENKLNFILGDKLNKSNNSRDTKTRQ